MTASPPSSRPRCCSGCCGPLMATPRTAACYSSPWKSLAVACWSLQMAWPWQHTIRPQRSDSPDGCTTGIDHSAGLRPAAPAPTGVTHAYSDSITFLNSAHQRQAECRHPLETAIAGDHHGSVTKLQTAGCLQSIGCAQIVLGPQVRGSLHNSRAEFHPLQIRAQEEGIKPGQGFRIPAAQFLPRRRSRRWHRERRSPVSFLPQLSVDLLLAPGCRCGGQGQQPVQTAGFGRDRSISQSPQAVVFSFSEHHGRWAVAFQQMHRAGSQSLLHRRDAAPLELRRTEHVHGLVGHA